MREDIYVLVGRRIRDERNKSGLTLEELSANANITPSFLGYLERGKKKASLETIQKLADALRIPVFSLFSSVPKRADEGLEYKVATRIESLLRDKRDSQKELVLKIVKVLSKSL